MLKSPKAELLDFRQFCSGSSEENRLQNLLFFRSFPQLNFSSLYDNIWVMGYINAETRRAQRKKISAPAASLR